MSWTGRTRLAWGSEKEGMGSGEGMAWVDGLGGCSGIVYDLYDRV